MGTIPVGKQPDPWTLAQTYIKNRQKSAGMAQYMLNQRDIADDRIGAQMQIAQNRNDAAMDRTQLRIGAQQDIAKARLDPAGVEERAVARARGLAAGKGGVGVTGARAIKTFTDTLRENGVNNPYALAAVAAHIQSESGGVPTSFVPDDNGSGPSGALLNWHDNKDGTGRLSGLKEFARKTGMPMTDPKTQALYFIQEGKSSESAGFQKLMNAKSYQEANAAMAGIQRYDTKKLPQETANRLALTMHYGPQYGLPKVSMGEAKSVMRDDRVADVLGPRDEEGYYKDQDGRRYHLFYPKQSQLALMAQQSHRAGELAPGTALNTWRYIPDHNVQPDDHGNVAYRQYADAPVAKKAGGGGQGAVPTVPVENPVVNPANGPVGVSAAPVAQSVSQAEDPNQAKLLALAADEEQADDTDEETDNALWDNGDE